MLFGVKRSSVAVVLAASVVHPAFAQTGGGAAKVQLPDFGPNVAVIPDSTGDGVADLAIGVSDALDGGGAVYVWAGPVGYTGPLPHPATADYFVPSASTDIVGLGSALKNVGDASGYNSGAVLWARAQWSAPDGTTQSAFVLVDLVSGEHIAEFVGDLPIDPWDDVPTNIVSLVGAEQLMAPRGGSSSPSGSDSGRFEGAGYAWALFHPLPHTWSSRVGKFVGISAGARYTAQYVYPNDQGRRNALRHGLWQAALTYEFGAEKAEELGDIHEEGMDVTHPLDTWVDQYNNEKARQIAEAKLNAGATLQEAQDCIAAAVENGTFIVSDDDPRIPDEIRQAQDEIDNE